MAFWAHSVIRDPGNDFTHPSPAQPQAESKEARDVVGYLNFVLEYVYDLPARIAAFRKVDIEEAMRSAEPGEAAK